MAISQEKYIRIISAVGGRSLVAQRDLIARIFIDDALIPRGQVVEFSGGAIAALNTVGEFFGRTSEEYAWAKKYFNFVSKRATQPSKISFYSASTDAAPTSVIGETGVTLAAIQAVTAGTLSIDVDGTVTEYDNINLSSATSLSGVATLVSTAITGGEASVVYMADEATKPGAYNRFQLKLAEDGSAEVSVSGTVADALKLANGIVSYGSAEATTKAAVLEESANISNNFFTFTFAGGVTAGEAAEIAEWNHAQNVRYMFVVNDVDIDTRSTMVNAVKDYDGTALNVADAGILPMGLFASVNYNNANAAVDAMYQQHPDLTATVSDTSIAHALDEDGVNYYGRTQQAGQWLEFYQDGVLQGSVSAMGVYANEAWLKDAITAAWLNLRLSIDTIPATTIGESLVTGALMSPINLALYNGVITPGKTLDATQKAYITQLTGDENAWLTVQTRGFHLSVTVVKYTESGREKYKGEYVLIYTKGDSINKVEGSDILI